jgi:hypothetical protein
MDSASAMPTMNGVCSTRPPAAATARSSTNTRMRGAASRKMTLALGSTASVVSSLVPATICFFMRAGKTRCTTAVASEATPNTTK